MICRNCNRSRITRPRGLCWACFYTPGVRELYPSTSKFARRGVGIGCRIVHMPEQATQARPGSAEKIAVLAERARRHEHLWHPQDATFADETRAELAICQAC